MIGELPKNVTPAQVAEDFALDAIVARETKRRRRSYTTYAYGTIYFNSKDKDVS